jgi:hypothetical protein
MNKVSCHPRTSRNSKNSAHSIFECYYSSSVETSNVTWTLSYCGSISHDYVKNNEFMTNFQYSAWVRNVHHLNIEQWLNVNILKAPYWIEYWRKHLYSVAVICVGSCLFHYAPEACAPNEGNLRTLARSRCADNRINLNCIEAGNVADRGFN